MALCAVGFMMEPWFPLGSWWWGAVALIAIYVGWYKEIHSSRFLRRRFLRLRRLGSPWVTLWCWLRHPLNSEKREEAEFLSGYNLHDVEDDEP